MVKFGLNDNFGKIMFLYLLFFKLLLTKCWYQAVLWSHMTILTTPPPESQPQRTHTSVVDITILCPNRLFYFVKLDIIKILNCHNDSFVTTDAIICVQRAMFFSRSPLCPMSKSGLTKAYVELFGSLLGLSSVKKC